MCTYVYSESEWKKQTWSSNCLSILRTPIVPPWSKVSSVQIDRNRIERGTLVFLFFFFFIIILAQQNQHQHDHVGKRKKKRSSKVVRARIYTPLLLAVSTGQGGSLGYLRSHADRGGKHTNTYTRIGTYMMCAIYDLATCTCSRIRDESMRYLLKSV